MWVFFFFFFSKNTITFSWLSQSTSQISNFISCGLYFVFSELRWEVIVRFVYTGTHFWASLFKLSFYKINYYKNLQGPSWPWLYGSWIYNYLCNQCLWCCGFESRSGRGVQHYVIKFVSDMRQVMVFSGSFGFLHQ